MPACGEPVVELPTLAELRRRAALALGGVPALVTESPSLGDLVRYMTDASKTSSSADWHHLALATIENHFILLAGKLSDDHQPPLSEEDVTNIAILLDHHAKIDASFARQWPASRSRLDVEYRSRATLLLWIAYCCAHKAVDKAYPELKLSLNYSVPLRSGDLRHLVLGDRDTLEALRAVAAYLQARRLNVSELFSLRAGKERDVDRLADAFYENNLLLPSQLGDRPVQLAAEDERAQALKRRAEHWEEVQQRKAKALQLRQQLQQVRNKLADVQCGSLPQLANTRRGLCVTTFADWNSKRRA